MPSINLLPWRADLRKRRQKEFLIGLGGAIGLAVLIGLLAHFSVSTMIDRQQARNDLLKDELAGGIHALALSTLAPGEPLPAIGARSG